MKKIMINSKCNLIFKIQNLIWIFISSQFFLTLSLTGCDVKTHVTDVNPSGKTVYVRLPWKTQGQSEYSIQDVPLSTLTDLTPLRGDAARIILSPQILVDHIDGSDANVRFSVDSKNRIIPLTQMTAQAFSIYAHMEQFYFWNRSLNLPPITSQKPRVGLNYNEYQKTNLGKFKVMNNAQFNGALRAILVNPYDENGVPLSVNGGVLAHEHFHALFWDLAYSHLVDQFYKDIEANKNKPKNSMGKKVSDKDKDKDKDNQKPSPLPTPFLSPLPLPSMPSTSGVTDFAVTLGRSGLGFSQELVNIENLFFENHNHTETSNKKNKSQCDLNDFTEDELEFYYNLILIKGINEGLADVWGWLYTQDVNFISHSLESIKLKKSNNDRELKAELLESFFTKNKIKEKIVNHRYCLDGAIGELPYLLGTQIARTLYKKITESHLDKTLSAQRSILLNFNERIFWSQKIVDKVSELKTKFSLTADHELTLAQFTKDLIVESIDSQISAEECENWNQFFNSDEMKELLKPHCAKN